MPGNGAKRREKLASFLSAFPPFPTSELPSCRLRPHKPTSHPTSPAFARFWSRYILHRPGRLSGNSFACFVWFAVDSFLFLALRLRGYRLPHIGSKLRLA